jgi:hypothetical protein
LMRRNRSPAAGNDNRNRGLNVSNYVHMLCTAS